MVPISLDIKSSTVEKLIDVVATAIGKFSAPYLLKKMMLAKGESLFEMTKYIDQAREKIGDGYLIGFNSDGIIITERDEKPELLNEKIERIEDRLKTIELKRQNNLDHISLFALSEAVSFTQPPSSTSVDQDWLNRFISISQDVSSEEIQMLWGRILANEVNRPGSFSLRSLELLKNLSFNEAKLFEYLMQFKVVADENSNYFFDNQYFSTPNGKNNYRLCQRALDEIGLAIGHLIWVTFVINEGDVLNFSYGEKKLRINSSEKGSELQLKGFSLTSIGDELSQLVKQVPKPDYFDQLIKDIENKGFKCQLL